MRTPFLILIVALATSPCFAAKKDFRGLFGSFRKEKFVENQASSTDFGLDISLSTLFPISSVVNSEENSSGGVSSPMYYANFFDYEFGAFLSFGYHWQVYLTGGSFAYDTRKENSNPSSSQQAAQDQPLFHEFEMSVVPILLGLRYRFTTDDIVPFVGLGAGPAQVYRKASYDYDPSGAQTATQMIGLLAGAGMAEFQAGFEFYITSNVGLRIEASALFLYAPTKKFDPNSLATYPIMTAQANPWLFRYASGVFFLF